ncbi:insulinase family protein [Candidatus Parcubacteria bacterium]|nr:insulinase family protein [Candidatus Parcubacteria bacterium]
MKYKKTTLPNGLRVIVVPIHDNPSTTVMVATETGSHYESKGENGLSHFLEHMLFKGTPTRPSSLSVSTELDSIGAESNAFTMNELTAYYAKSEKRHWKKLLEVVSDIYLNPSFPVAELEKERGVILQEIAMYQDLPQSHVWDVLAQLLYGDTPHGRSILGFPENIKKFQRQDFMGYHRKHYVASKTLVVVSGAVTPQEVLSEVKKIFKDLPEVKKRGKDKIKESQKVPAIIIEKKKTDQTHMIMALRTFGANDKRSILVSVLLAVLGEGMSSRLFQRLRGEMGACYYVRVANDIYTDHGYAAISTGVEKGRVVEVVKALIDECKRITYEQISDKELQKAKDYIVSHLYMGLETSDSLAVHYLTEEIVRGDSRDPQEIEKAIRKVTAKEIMDITKEIFKDESLNLAIVGNVSDQKGIKKALTFK